MSNHHFAQMTFMLNVLDPIQLPVFSQQPIWHKVTYHNIKNNLFEKKLFREKTTIMSNDCHYYFKRLYAMWKYPIWHNVVWLNCHLV